MLAGLADREAENMRALLCSCLAISDQQKILNTIRALENRRASPQNTSRKMVLEKLHERCLQPYNQRPRDFEFLDRLCEIITRYEGAEVLDRGYTPASQRSERDELVRARRQETSPNDWWQNYSDAAEPTQVSGGNWDGSEWSWDSWNGWYPRTSEATGCDSVGSNWSWHGSGDFASS